MSITRTETGPLAEPVTVSAEAPTWRRLTIRRCDRCGSEHAEPIDFMPFSVREIGRWNGWAICPTNGEPLLMHFHTKTCECEIKGRTQRVPFE